MVNLFDINKNPGTFLNASGFFIVKINFKLISENLLQTEPVRCLSKDASADSRSEEAVK